MINNTHPLTLEQFADVNLFDWFGDSLKILKTHSIMINTHSLTLEEIKTFSSLEERFADVNLFDWLSDSFNNDYFDCNDRFSYIYNSNKDLADNNWVIGQVTIKDKQYTIIHGFPGDNPIGLIFNETTAIQIYGGRCSSHDQNENVNKNLESWYMQATNDATECVQSF